MVGHEIVQNINKKHYLIQYSIFNIVDIDCWDTRISECSHTFTSTKTSCIVFLVKLATMEQGI